jgi:hypothetical protein
VAHPAVAKEKLDGKQEQMTRVRKVLTLPQWNRRPEGSGKKLSDYFCDIDNE